MYKYYPAIPPPPYFQIKKNVNFPGVPTHNHGCIPDVTPLLPHTVIKATSDETCQKHKAELQNPVNDTENKEVQTHPSVLISSTENEAIDATLLVPEQNSTKHETHHKQTVSLEQPNKSTTQRITLPFLVSNNFPCITVICSIRKLCFYIPKVK